MSQRLQKLFTLEDIENAYGSPVSIEAGGLIKDTGSGRVIARLYLKNGSDRNIKSVLVGFYPGDEEGYPISGMRDYRYDAENAEPGVIFGADTGVILPSDDTLSFTCDIKEIEFDDGDHWDERTAMKAKAEEDARIAAEERAAAEEKTRKAEEEARIAALDKERAEEQARLAAEGKAIAEARAREAVEEARIAAEERAAAEEKTRKAEEEAKIAAKIAEEEASLRAARAEEQAKLAREEAEKEKEEARIAAEEAKEARLAREEAEKEKEEARIAAEEAEKAKLAAEQARSEGTVDLGGYTEENPEPEVPEETEKSSEAEQDLWEAPSENANAPGFWNGSEEAPAAEAPQEAAEAPTEAPASEEAQEQPEAPATEEAPAAEAPAEEPAETPEAEPLTEAPASEEVPAEEQTEAPATEEAPAAETPAEEPAETPEAEPLTEAPAEEAQEQPEEPETPQLGYEPQPALEEETDAYKEDQGRSVIKLVGPSEDEEGNEVIELEGPKEEEFRGRLADLSPAYAGGLGDLSRAAAVSKPEEAEAPAPEEEPAEVAAEEPAEAAATQAGESGTAEEPAEAAAEETAEGPLTEEAAEAADEAETKPEAPSVENGVPEITNDMTQADDEEDAASGETGIDLSAYAPKDDTVESDAGIASKPEEAPNAGDADKPQAEGAEAKAEESAPSNTVFAQESEDVVPVPAIINDGADKELTGEDHSGRNLVNIIVFGAIAVAILLVLFFVQH